MRNAVFFMTGALLLLSGCKSRSGFTSYGTEVISADAAADRDVSTAILEVHRNLANYIVNDDGTKSDPTYKAGSNNVKIGENKDDQKLRYSRSYLEWKGKKGQLYRIETTQIADELIVIICESDDKDANMVLHNEMVKQLTARGLESRQ